MTVEWYDLAQRIAAARSGQVVPRLRHAPLPRLPHPVAVRAETRAGRVTVTACVEGEASRTCAGEDGLRLLGDLGVRLGTGQWASLVTDLPGTLPTLVDLARSTERDGPLSEVAAQVGWWSDRADFPGTSAVILTPEACQRRWVTGGVPEVDRQPETWRTWLGVGDHGCAGVLDVLALVGAGPVLPGLGSITDDDSYSWQRASSEHSDGWDWRTPDTASRAANGLRARCDTADLWAASLLGDPLWRRRAVHTGHVVAGVASVPPNTRNNVDVSCDRMDARLRAGAAVVGWVGPPTGSGPRFSGTVSGTGVEHGRLVLNLGSVTGSTAPPSGARVTLMGAPPNEHATRDGRRRYRSLYGTRSSWLTTGRTPTPQRRDVPLDVLIAGAED